jgi:ornithine--oxo-acid transaminase
MDRRKDPPNPNPTPAGRDEIPAGASAADPRAAEAGARKAEQLALVGKYSANNYRPLEVVLSRGAGVWVWDTDGKKYLDCLAAYSAVNQGHRHPRIIQALQEQAGRLTLSSRAFHNDRMGPYLQRVCEVTGVGMREPQALPMNSGAEAVETAIKLARKWGYEHKKVPTDQAEILVCEGNFHGRTTTIVGFSSEPGYRDGFGPFAPGFRIIPYGSAEALEKAITPNTVAFLVEPIQGEAGVIVPPAGYLAAVREICTRRGVLLLDDEIQTGLGRTGKLLCWMHEPEAVPDVLILGKALGGGVLPVSAIVAPRELMSVFRPGGHGSTFGGNPLGAAVGIASLDVIVEERLAERALELGEWFRTRLRERLGPRAIGQPGAKIREIRGKGLMTGIELEPHAGTARAFCEKLAVRGALAKDTHEQTVRITPPLVIEKPELDWLIEQIAECLAQAAT